MTRLLSIFAATFLLGSVYGLEIPNGDFADGLNRWEKQPAGSTAALEDAPDGGKVLALGAVNANSGVTSASIGLTPEEAAGTLTLALDLKADALSSGIFGISIYPVDKAGKRLGQISIFSRSEKDKATDWKTLKLQFGARTAKPLPEGTAALQIRFSFYEKTGKVTGKVWVRNLALSSAAAKSAAPKIDAAWPRSISAKVGDLGIRLESRSFWTLYRIEYLGKRIGEDVYGSHYGHVFNFKGVGFVGSGHVENEEEQMLELKLEIDGAQVAEVRADYPAAKSLVLTRRAKVRTLEVASVLKIADNKIDEAVEVTALADTELSYGYICMYPWVTGFSDYAVLDENSDIRGKFTDSKKFVIDRPVTRVAIYNAGLGIGVETTVMEAVNAEPRAERYWDVPERYRKHYGVVALNRTLKAGEKLRYRTVTTPFQAGADNWIDTARGL
ncbi:MAG: hypothetical protein AB7F32_06945 [Victivallaceae bacterium]